ncbi:2686_t:CDS:2 [Paraglomus brasilianum]|uniref:Dolichyldiphosphatase n=1 Tax=Paraglomus brasilianum TaxID=144538 RepID=A0A9N9ANK9_9GLOM|nr:2686_t:CDS:2 [Paraglomus brasilianum]
MARREIVAINMFIGQLTCELTNAILKRIIREQRPTDKLGDGYGMPSSHAQFVGYFAVFSILHLYTRVYLNYHTPTQVIVGYVIGSIFAACWFVLVEYVLRPIGVLKKAVDSPVAKYFYVKDSINVPNVLKVEYSHWKNVETDKVK